MCLSSIFQKKDACWASDSKDRVNVRRVPVEMYDDNGPRANGDCRLDSARIDCKRVPIGLDRNRYRTAHCDGEPCGNEGMRWHDHLVARTYTPRAEHERNRFKAISNSNRSLCGAVSREFKFELRDLGTKYI